VQAQILNLLIVACHRADELQLAGVE